MKIKNGRCLLVPKEVPDLDEAKRLWREGKSAQFIFEEHKRKRKKAKDEDS